MRDQLSRFLSTFVAAESNECIATSAEKYLEKISATRKPFEKSLRIVANLMSDRAESLQTEAPGPHLRGFFIGYERFRESSHRRRSLFNPVVAISMATLNPLADAACAAPRFLQVATKTAPQGLSAHLERFVTEQVLCRVG